MSTTNNININELFEEALKDPSLLSTINVDELLESVEDEKNDYLENKTMEMLNKENFEVVTELNCSIDEKKKLCDSLIGYRLVDELHELHKGKHIRWIRHGTTKLTSGGIVVDIKFLNNGTHVLCKNYSGRFTQYKYDECITFQKLTETEQLIMMAYGYVSNEVQN